MSKRTASESKRREKRRLKAAELLASGMQQSEVARRLGVHRQSVSRWNQSLRSRGVEALKSRTRPGRPRQLDDESMVRLEQILIEGPEAYGFPTNLWTLGRVARVIRESVGAAVHPGHVWKVRGAMGWSCQRPVGRATERNEAEIERWKRVEWPRIKKKPGEKGARSSPSMKAGFPSDPTASARGRREDRRRSSSTPSGGKTSRRSRE